MAVLICPLIVSGFSLRIGKYPWVAAQVRISKFPELFNSLNFSIKFPEQFCQYRYLSLRLLNKKAVVCIGVGKNYTLYDAGTDNTQFVQAGNKSEKRIKGFGMP